MRKTRIDPRGFSLLEVMVASALLIIGFLGVANLQWIAGQSGQSAKRATQATALANEVLTRLTAKGYNDAALIDQSTSNNAYATAYNQEALGAIADYCVTKINGVTIPAADSVSDTNSSGTKTYATCTTGGSAGGAPTLDGIASAAEWTARSSNGLSPFFIAYNVEDFVPIQNAKAKIIVARVLWRDPATGHMRTTSAMGIKGLPPAIDFSNF